jgi:hypothetical protein
MLKCASAYTYEIDNPEDAYGEVKAQLDEKITLLDNTIGIVTCHPEFVGSGALQYICENLPFDVVGTTTSAQAVDGEFGELILTIFVMTSDDISFKAAVTECLDAGISEPIKASVTAVIAGNPEPPGLALVFAPLILKYSGDSYTEEMTNYIPNTPIFGSIAIDDTLTYEQSETIYNGDTYRTAMVYVFCYGNINPRFIVGTFPDEKTMPYKGEITKSSGSFVSEINNISAYKYFESIGFIENGVLSDNFKLVPFAVDQIKRADYDGISVVRGIAIFTDDGTAVFRGDVDEGSVFSMLTFEAEDVLSTTRETLEQVSELPDVNGALMFTCIGRHIMTMSVSPLAEPEITKDGICSDIPFMMSYAGGEICPTLIKDGVPTNRFHNYSVIVLVL